MAAQSKDYISQLPLQLVYHVTRFWPMGSEVK